MSTLTLPKITEEHKRQFREEGFFILDSVVHADQLAILRDECDQGVEDIHKEMDERGEDTLFISHRGRRYFIPWRTRTSERLRSFVFGEILAEVCKETIGPNASLFLDQFVVKAAEKGMNFSWHQDSGYIPFDHAPYLSCWVSLDDVSEENGTVYMLPYSQLGIKSRVTHTADPKTNDMVGYYGTNPGVPVIVPAGSIAVFSSVCFHRSGPNTTDKARRVYLCQFSVEPIVSPYDQMVYGEFTPFLKDGAIVPNAGVRE